MNLHLRLTVLLLTSWLGTRKDLLGDSVMSLRVMPWDCDLNGHVTNARYLAFMDLGRIHVLAQSGILCELISRRWFPVISATEITHVRPIRLFQPFTLTSRILTWDEKFWYFEHWFMSDGKLHAIATTRGVFLYNRKCVQPGYVADLAGADDIPPMMPPFVLKWQELHAMKKRQYAYGSRYTLPTSFSTEERSVVNGQAH